MSAKTLKIKISLGSAPANGAKQKKHTATNEEIGYASATPALKSNQPFKLAALLTIGAIAIMSWLFFAPSSELHPATVSAAIEGGAPITEKQTTVTLSNKSVQPIPSHALPIIPVPIVPIKEILDVEEKPLFSESDTAASPAQSVTEAVVKQITPVKVEKTNNNIRRAQFTNGIIKREPIDNVDQLRAQEKELKKLYYFTELRGLKGKTITHQWRHENNVVAEIEFKVRGNRWRVYSSKYLQSHKKGSWQVVVKDEKGNSLETSQFTYQ